METRFPRVHFKDLQGTPESVKRHLDHGRSDKPEDPTIAFDLYSIFVWLQPRHYREGYIIKANFHCYAPSPPGPSPRQLQRFSFSISLASFGSASPARVLSAQRQSDGPDFSRTDEFYGQPDGPAPKVRRTSGLGFIGSSISLVTPHVEPDILM